MTEPHPPAAPALTLEQRVDVSRELRAMLKGNMETEDYFGMWGECDIDRFVTDFLEAFSAPQHD